MANNQPTVLIELIEYLERVYPDRVPTVKEAERQIWMDVGRVDVVRHLKMLHESQVERALIR